MRNDRPKSLFPWREEDKQRSSLGSLPPRPLRAHKVCSRPKSAGQEHLELYLAKMEKDRITRLGEVFGRLLRESAQRWNLADARMRQIEERLQAAKGG